MPRERFTDADDNKFVVEHGEGDMSPKREGFNCRGEPIDPDSPLCVAKRVSADGMTTLQVKVNRALGRINQLFDPVTNKSADLNRSNNHLNQDHFIYFSVGPTAFEEYLQYLKTGQRVHLKMAQRSI